jgi:hypothetical protein
MNEKHKIIEETTNEYIDENGIKMIERKIYIKVEDKDKYQKEYYENNKERIKKYIIEYKKKRYQSDEKYRDEIKAKRRESYQKKKKEKKDKINYI